MRSGNPSRASRLVSLILSIGLLSCNGTSDDSAKDTGGSDGAPRIADTTIDVRNQSDGPALEATFPPEDLAMSLDTLELRSTVDIHPSVDGLAETTDSDLPEMAPLGTVSGSCGELGTLFAANAPTLLVNTYDFFEAESFDSSLLGSGATKRYEQDNQGGSSLCSEVMSIQLLEECEGALLHKTEIEIVYATAGSIADYTATLDEQRIGVSVTRAYKGPMGDEYTLDDATTLLTKKLNGLLEAADNVSPEDAWEHSLLHVWTLRSDWVPTLVTAWEALPAEIRANSIVMVTLEEDSLWIVPESCKP
jgi:hypothetical protein